MSLLQESGVIAVEKAKEPVSTQDESRTVTRQSREGNSKGSLRLRREYIIKNVTCKCTIEVET